MSTPAVIGYCGNYSDFSDFDPVLIFDNMDTVNGNLTKINTVAILNTGLDDLFVAIDPLLNSVYFDDGGDDKWHVVSGIQAILHPGQGRSFSCYNVDVFEKGLISKILITAASLDGPSVLWTTLKR